MPRGSLLDADVYFRFLHSGSHSIHRTIIDDIRIGQFDVSGPAVVSVGSNVPMAGPVSSVDVQFTEPIPPTTDWLANVEFQSPDGRSIPWSGSPTSSADQTTYTFAFAPAETLNGIYSVRVAADVADFAGNGMNQDGDAVNRESNGDDAFSGSFEIGPATAQTLPFTQGFEASNLTDLQGWSFATDDEIQPSAHDHPRQGATPHELAPGQTKHLPALFAEQVGVKHVKLGPAAIHAGVTVDPLYRSAGIALPLDQIGLVSDLELALVVARTLAFLQGLLFDVRQGVGQELTDDGARPLAAIRPLLLHRRDRSVHGRPPVLADFAKPAQQLHPIPKPGPLGVKLPHEVEVLVKYRPPFRFVHFFTGAVEQCHRRLPGPAQDLHLRFVGRLEAPTRVNDVEDAAAVQDGLQEFDFVGKLIAAAVGVDERMHRTQALIGARRALLEPGKRTPRILKTRAVDDPEHHPAADLERVLRAPLRGAWVAGDRNRRIFGQGGHDRGLALVDVANDDEHGGVARGRFTPFADRAHVSAASNHR